MLVAGNRHRHAGVVGQHEMSAADLSRVLGSDRSLGPKLLRGERRLTVDHTSKIFLTSVIINVSLISDPFKTQPNAA
jgi:antitoxin component HigA of HigAB toxin-antitoxin module